MRLHVNRSYSYSKETSIISARSQCDMLLNAPKCQLEYIYFHSIFTKQRIFPWQILNMSRLNENYYLRKCYLKREQVPTQSVMINKMSPPLAKVYFKSMGPKLKVLAGLEPPMKGGGNDWYVPPKEILKGRAVMMPVKKDYLSKLGFNGIASYGDKLVQNHEKRMDEEKRRVLLESDINWKNTITVSCRQQWEDISKIAAKNNSEKILKAFKEFTTLYMVSINKIENFLFEAAVQEIKTIEKKTNQMMMDNLETLLAKQATMLYDRYTDKLEKEQERLKTQFIRNVENSRSSVTSQVRDINMEKHVAVEKLRQLLECQNLACQVYVALKEREVCQQEMDLAEHEHTKKVNVLKDEIAMQNFEIRLLKEKEKKRKDFNRIWKGKVCQVVKKFQMFVSYCLNKLPEQADFFINMEKLMLLQLNEAIENPLAESIFEPEEENIPTPIPRPHPFFLFCDKGYKPQLEQNLCPKHCTSSASQLPVIVVNKRCIYAACDNFQVYTDKIKHFIQGMRGDDKDFQDEHEYQYDVPVKYTASQQLLEAKLESSLQQVLQKEIPNIRELPINCLLCQKPYCFCSPTDNSDVYKNNKILNKRETEVEPPLPFSISGDKIDNRTTELEHEREPKWESYLKFVMPSGCRNCGLAAKKHLMEHMPPYMINRSRYDTPKLPHYETCSVATLKKLVKAARGVKTPPPEPAQSESKTKDIGIQYSDLDFDLLCTCFSDDEVEKLLTSLMINTKELNTEVAERCRVVDGAITPTYLREETATFATDRALSLRNLIAESPKLEELFTKKNCSFDSI